MAILLVLVFQSICIGFSKYLYLTNQYKRVIMSKKNIFVKAEGEKMPYQHKQNETLYRGRSRWLQVPDDYKAKPGENVIDTDDVIKKVERNGFEITYLSYFFDLFDQLAGKKYAVVKYILQNKSSENTLIITNRELAKKCNVGINTVTDTLKILKEAGLIMTRTGAIMLNPKLAHRGKAGRERYLLQRFTAFEENENDSNGTTETTGTESQSV